jgi:hypothetical protein
MVQFVDEVETGRSWINGKPALRTAVLQAFHPGVLPRPFREACKLGDHGARRAACHLLQYRYRSHCYPITLSSSAGDRKMGSEHDHH